MKNRKQNKPLIDTADAVPLSIPKFLYSIFLKPGAEKVLGVEKLNRVYANAREMETDSNEDPGIFAERIFKELKIDYQIPEKELEAVKKIEGPLALVCNHPYGGLEALFLVLLLSKIRSDYRIMANYILENVTNLRDKLILVDPFGGEEAKKKNAGALRGVLAYLKEGGMIGIFPSGEVAALDIKTGKIKEPEWNPNIAKLIRKTNASVVPIYFHGSNSILFHLAGIIHPRLRTTLLIREFVHPRSHRLRFKIGKVISPEKIARYPDPEELTRYLKSKTYLLASTYTQTKSGIHWGNSTKKITKKNVTEVISPVPDHLLRDEIERLGEGHRLLTYQNMEVYLFKAMEAPAMIIELGRLRELTFRDVGEGTGRNLDLDNFDQYYEHIVIWNKEKSEIVGAYRIARVDEVLAEKGKKGLYITELFDLDAQLFTQINPCLELGRSIVRKEYQKSYLPLMLLWMGIGHFLVDNPRYVNLVGPVSISNSFNNMSKQFLVEYLRKEHSALDLCKLVKPKHPFKSNVKITAKMYEALQISTLNDVQEAFTDIEPDDAKVPILIKHYLRLGSKVLSFNVDPNFQNAIDALILTNIPNMGVDVLKKYMNDSGYEVYRNYHQIKNSPE